MTRKFLKPLLLLAGLCLILTSCKGAGQTDANSILDPTSSVDEDLFCASALGCTGSPEIYYAPSIMKATSQDISYNKVECSGKDKGKVCVVICHRPPGNPANSKTMVLPLPAVFAHLKHGNSKVPDTIGTCDDPIAEEPPMDEQPGEGEGPGDDDGDQLPKWCEENLDIDADCDGIGDGPGVPPTPIY